MTLQQVTDIALSLPIDLRMDLLDKLNASINPVSPEIEQAWAEEAQRRMAAYLAGEVSAIDGKLAFESIFKRYSE